jgi:hypothetical protein
MAMSILALVLLAGLQDGAASAAQDFSGILSSRGNAIRSCEIMNRSDGGHLLIGLAKRGAGDSIHIEVDDSAATFDYVFGNAKGPTQHLKTTSAKLGSLDQIDIPLKSAVGLKGKKVTAIFTRNGIYSIYIGFGFRSAEEAEIYGACRISIQAK